jgi:hypothetical protein
MKDLIDNGRMGRCCDPRNPSTCVILLSAYLPIAILACRFPTTAAEEDIVEEGVVVESDETAIMQDYDDDSWFVLLLMSLLFGFVITLFGAWVGYFSTLEDKLMRRYWTEGETIVARVISSDFTRGGGSNTVNACVAPNNSASDRFRQPDNSEYLCFCEYDRTLAQNYSVRIRKQCKAKAWDFVFNPRPGSEQMLVSLKKSMLQLDENGNEVMFVEFPNQHESCCPGAGADNDNDDDEHAAMNGADGPPERKFLEMLILPGHELSALPKKAVQRSCSTRYQFSTVGLILFDLCLAAFCTWWAINEVTSLEDDGQRARGWCAIIVFVVLVALEIPLIHSCCHGMLVDALKEEYLDSGDFVPLQDDASSLSSGSDVYLAGRSRSYGSSFLL